MFEQEKSEITNELSPVLLTLVPVYVVGAILISRAVSGTLDSFLIALVICLLYLTPVAAFVIPRILRLSKYSALDRSTLTVSSERLILGEALTVNIKLTARRPITIKHVAIELICLEVQRKRFGAKPVEIVQIHWGKRWGRQNTLHLLPGKDYIVRKSFQIPSNGMHTFSSGKSGLFEVAWMVILKLKLTRKFEAQHEIELYVAPLKTRQNERGGSGNIIQTAGRHIIDTTRKTA